MLVTKQKGFALLLWCIQISAANAETILHGGISGGFALENATAADLDYATSSGLFDSWIQIESDTANGILSGHIDFDANTDKYSVVNDNNTELFFDDYFDESEYYRLELSDMTYQNNSWSIGQVKSIIGSEGFVDGMDDNLNVGIDYGLNYVKIDNSLNFVKHDYGVQLSRGSAYEDDNPSNKYLLSGTGTGEFESDVSFATFYTGTNNDIDWALDGQYSKLVNDKSDNVYLGLTGHYQPDDLTNVLAAITSGRSVVSGENELSAGIKVESLVDDFTITGSWVINSLIPNNIKLNAAYLPLRIDVHARLQDHMDYAIGGSWLYSDEFFDLDFNYESILYAVSHETQRAIDFIMLYRVSPVMVYNFSYRKTYPSGNALVSSETLTSIEYTRTSGMVIGFYYEKDTGANTPLKLDNSFYHGVHFALSYQF